MIGRNTHEILNVYNTSASVIALYPVAKDTYALKTVFYRYSTSNKTLLLDNICTVYAVANGKSVNFMSMPQYKALHWLKEQVGSVTFYYPKGYRFNKTNAMKLDSFNVAIAKKFNSEPLSFKYFICESNEHLYQTLGYQFTPSQHVPNQNGAITNSINASIFAGNNSEYYPHEIVHLYTNLFWGKDGFYYHSWFDEGIAVLFGGSRDKNLDWHLGKLKSYLEQNPNEKLIDVLSLGTIPNGEAMTEYVYSIGGLLSKLIYEKEGMGGIFDLLSSGKEDADFYRTIERKFGVKKENLGSFIRSELKKMKSL